MTPQTQNPAGERGFGNAVRAGQGQYTGAPIDLLLTRLDGVKKAGKGYIAKCPAHSDRTASLSVAEGTDGRCILHCFSGCAALDVVQSVGLQLVDLFPRRIHGDMTREQRTELRMLGKQAGWAAALNVLSLEAAVVTIAAGEVMADRALSWDDYCRLVLAHERIADARAVLK